MVYSSSAATNFLGSYETNMLSDVGSDVYLFVSGTQNPEAYRPPGLVGHPGAKDVVLFGGDVVVSGTFYADRMVVELDQTTTGSMLVSGSLFVSQSVSVGSTNAGMGPDVVPNAVLDVAGDNQQEKPTVKITHQEDANNAVDIYADSLTSAAALTVSVDNNSMNGAKGIWVSTTSTSTDDYTLVKLAKTSTQGDDTNAIIGLDIDWDMTSGTAGRAFRVDSAQTTGTAAEILVTGRTTGTGLLVKDTATNDNAGSLVTIHQDGSRAGTAASIGLDINFNTTGNANARAFKIDSEQTTGTVVEIDATEITDGTAIAIDVGDARGSGTGLSITDAATNDTAGNLVSITQSGSRAGSAASIGLFIDYNTVANANARAFKVDSEQTTGVVVEVDADAITSGTGVQIHGNSNSLAAGKLLDVSTSSTSTSAYTLVRIAKSTSNGDNSNSIVGLDIDWDMTSGTAGRAARIVSVQTDGTIMEMTGDSLTSGKGLSITSTSDNFNDGNLLYVDWSGDTDNEQSVVHIKSSGTNAKLTSALKVEIAHAYDSSLVAAPIHVLCTAAQTASSAVILENSNNVTSSRPELTFYKSSSTVADGMDIGEISFVGRDTGGGTVNYVVIEVTASEATNDKEAGKIEFKLQADTSADAGSSAQSGRSSRDTD